MGKNFIDRFYAEDMKGQFWSLNKKIGIGLAVLFLAIIMINTTGCTKNEESVSIELSDQVPQEITQNFEKESVKVGNDGVNAAIASDDVEIVSSGSHNQEPSTVAFAVESIGRSDPFLPEGEVVVSKTRFDEKAVNGLMAPPESIVVDSSAVDVITTKVSGIMFDNLNPSAILNIAGSDYLVRSGDIVNGYKVLSIAKDTVTVQNGVNIYKASVGEIFTGENINYNTVSNLENKFGSKNNLIGN